ncbi:hypothetical protein VOLCADRAFT_87688 [Volvox carteri f. nagariensis]|uniref:Helitron helicase-like domain-containing protein n=1 Tax=Volvox carteri f. nagariensis TaxID=3068 RepID=D8TLZ8_VOLCA|nr:uncharacterized protein VOLCADRAFT_87688 [Volvox carteri f. nagariensis]EFJ51419.1 hypothetical protein VOLCADRAFT_87688 [Volvox carteri f. nagariensis]|eukprot:XP_002947371.1 hypothetical protein VOLCADRAFT_87688 [Volvox carteri f. nagariensis]
MDSPDAKRQRLDSSTSYNLRCRTLVTTSSIDPPDAKRQKLDTAASQSSTSTVGPPVAATDSRSVTFHVTFTAGPTETNEDRLFAGAQSRYGSFIAGVNTAGQGIVIMQIDDVILGRLESSHAFGHRVTFINVDSASLLPYITSRFAGVTVGQFKVSSATRISVEPSSAVPLLYSARLRFPAYDVDSDRARPEDKHISDGSALLLIPHGGMFRGGPFRKFKAWVACGNGDSPDAGRVELAIRESAPDDFIAQLQAAADSSTPLYMYGARISPSSNKAYMNSVFLSGSLVAAASAPGKRPPKRVHTFQAAVQRTTAAIVPADTSDMVLAWEQRSRSALVLPSDGPHASATLSPNPTSVTVVGSLPVLPLVLTVGSRSYPVCTDSIAVMQQLPNYDEFFGSASFADDNDRMAYAAYDSFTITGTITTKTEGSHALKLLLRQAFVLFSSVASSRRDLRASWFLLPDISIPSISCKVSIARGTTASAIHHTLGRSCGIGPAWSTMRALVTDGRELRAPQQHVATTDVVPVHRPVAYAAVLAAADHATMQAPRLLPFTMHSTARLSLLRAPLTALLCLLVEAVVTALLPPRLGGGFQLEMKERRPDSRSWRLGGTQHLLLPRCLAVLVFGVLVLSSADATRKVQARANRRRRIEQQLQRDGQMHEPTGHLSKWRRTEQQLLLDVWRTLAVARPAQVVAWLPVTAARAPPPPEPALPWGFRKMWLNGHSTEKTGLTKRPGGRIPEAALARYDGGDVPEINQDGQRLEWPTVLEANILGLGHVQQQIYRLKVKNRPSDLQPITVTMHGIAVANPSLDHAAAVVAAGQFLEFGEDGAPLREERVMDKWRRVQNNPYTSQALLNAVKLAFMDILFGFKPGDKRQSNPDCFCGTVFHICIKVEQSGRLALHLHGMVHLAAIPMWLPEPYYDIQDKERRVFWQTPLVTAAPTTPMAVAPTPMETSTAATNSGDDSMTDATAEEDDGLTQAEPGSASGTDEDIGNGDNGVQPAPPAASAGRPPAIRAPQPDGSMPAPAYDFAIVARGKPCGTGGEATDTFTPKVCLERCTQHLVAGVVGSCTHKHTDTCKRFGCAGVDGDCGMAYPRHIRCEFKWVGDSGLFVLPRYGPNIVPHCPAVTMVLGCNNVFTLACELDRQYIATVEEQLVLPVPMCDPEVLEDILVQAEVVAHRTTHYATKYVAKATSQSQVTWLNRMIMISRHFLDTAAAGGGDPAAAHEDRCKGIGNLISAANRTTASLTIGMAMASFKLAGHDPVNAAFTADLHVKLQGTDLTIASLENVRKIVTTR